MAFPASLTLVEVHGAFPVPTANGEGATATGTVTYTSHRPLIGAGDNAIVPPFTVTATLVDGECTVHLPATNDPQWTPQDWAYSVLIQTAGGTIRGTLQLDHESSEVELGDLLQVDGAAVTGVTYATLAQLNAAQAAAAALVDDLSGVTDASAARANLELGGAATLDVGTTEGTVAAGDDARIAGALQTTGGTITGDLVVGDVEGDKAYRLKSSGSALDFDAAGTDLFLSAFPEADFSGTQRNYLRLEANVQLARALGRWLFTGSAFADSGVADLDPSTGLAGLGAKNGLTNIPFAGRRTAAGPPTTGTWAVGDLVQAADGFWQCTVAGEPGTWLLVAAAEGASRIVDAGEYVIPRRDIITESPATSGNLYVTHFTAARTETIQTIRTGIGGTVATSAEHAWLGIMSWDGTDYTPVAASVDDPTRWTSTFQTYDTQLYAWDHPGEEGFEGWDKIAGQRYAFWVLWIGEGTAPSLPAGGGWYADALEEPRVNAYIGSQTQPPAAPISGSFFGPDSRRFQGLMER